MTRFRRCSPEFLLRLRRLHLSIARLGGGEIGGVRSGFRRGSGLEFTDHRRYVAGDDLRYLDWNVYGRLEELQVKEFGTDESLHLVVFLDRSASMGVGSGSKMDSALDLVGALGGLVLLRGERVTLVALEEAAFAPTRSLCGRGRILEFLEILDTIEPGGADRPTFGLQEFFGQGRPAALRPVVLLVSDFLRPVAQLESLFSLAALRSVGPHALHIIDSTEFRSIPDGPVVLVDSETGLDLPIDIDSHIRKAYRDRLKAHHRAVRRTALERRVAYGRAESDRPLEETIGHLVRGRWLFQ